MRVDGFTVTSLDLHFNVRRDNVHTLDTLLCTSDEI